MNQVTIEGRDVLVGSGAQRFVRLLPPLPHRNLGPRALPHHLRQIVATATICRTMANSESQRDEPDTEVEEILREAGRHAHLSGRRKLRRIA